MKSVMNKNKHNKYFNILKFKVLKLVYMGIKYMCIVM